jgi:hypothetical protein
MSEKKQSEKPASTYIDGIAASEHLDSAGERIEIKGIDISSLTVDGVLNFEHKSNEASQIVGKIIYAKKILKKEDCENERQEYFWNKIKTPYLYIIGELFDAVGHKGAQDVAAMLKYDSLKEKYKSDNDRKLINFSIEGQKLEKRGSLIKKCIARKVSITITPCNKACEAEELKDYKSLEKSDKFSFVQDFSLSGDETSSCQIMKSEYMPKRTFTPKTAPDKIKSGDRISYKDQPKAKTGKDIYGTPPKFNNQGKQTAAGAAPKPTSPTPASNTAPHTPSGSKKPKLKLISSPQFASTNRRYGIMKNNIRKAITASVGTSSAPGAQANVLNKEECEKAFESCQPKIDMMKPYASDTQRKWAHTKAGTKALGGKKAVKEWDKESKGKDLPEKIQKAKVDEQYKPEDRQQIRSERKTQSSSKGYTSKDAGQRSALRSKMQKSDIVVPAKEMVAEHKKLVDVLESPSHKDDKKEAKKQRKELKEYKEKLKKSEAEQILKFVQQKYPEMGKAEQVALAKTVALLRKAEKPFHGYNKKKHAKSGGLNDSYRKKYNKETGSNLKRPVTGKVKAGSKAAKRRKSFCARMSGVKGPTSKEGKLTPKGAALKRWRC